MELSPSAFYSTLKRTHESYHNPRLLNDASEYLSVDHIEELRRESEIVYWDEYTEPKIIPGVGSLRRVGIITKQGYTYDTLIGIPEVQECNVPVIGTTAWTTSLRGHNEHLVRNLVRAGNYVFYVGAEGSYLTDEAITPTSPITLANSAAAVLNFSYHMAEELRRDQHDINEEDRLCLGESRGGMVAEGIDALADSFGQNIAFSDQVAPCLPERLQSLRDMYRLGEQLIKEPVEMYRLIGSLTLAHLRYYPHTIDVRPACVQNQITIGGALFSGETGAMSRHAPGTTLKHITVFDNDFASNRTWWENRYDGDELIRVTPLRGGHMTIADLQTLRYVLARNKAAQEFIDSGTPLTQDVFERSHELYLSQYQSSTSMAFAA